MSAAAVNRVPPLRLGRLRLPLALALMACCLAVLLWAGMRANAAWHYTQARAGAEPMLERGIQDAAVLEGARSHLALALARMPAHPAYLDLAGELYELEATLPGVVGRERREALTAAADHYRRSLAVRPLWPYGWARLLGAKARLGQIDDEFRLALERTLVTGPAEPRLQRRAIELGLRHWAYLGARERALLRSAAAAALSVQPAAVFELAQRFGRPDMVCQEGAGHQQIARWCQEQ